MTASVYSLSYLHNAANIPFSSFKMQIIELKVQVLRRKDDLEELGFFLNQIKF